jgi:hypothetical protein
MLDATPLWENVPASLCGVTLRKGGPRSRLREDREAEPKTEALLLWSFEEALEGIPTLRATPILPEVSAHGSRAREAAVGGALEGMERMPLVALLSECPIDDPIPTEIRPFKLA